MCEWGRGLPVEVMCNSLDHEQITATYEIHFPANLLPGHSGDTWVSYCEKCAWKIHRIDGWDIRPLGLVGTGLSAGADPADKVVVPK